MPEPLIQDPGIPERLRILEARYNLMRERLLIINQNFIQQYKKTLTEIKTLESDIKEIKKDVFEVKDTLKDIIRELQFFAKKENLQILEKYINFWNPMNFVTEKDVRRIIREVIKNTKETREQKGPMVKS